VAKLAGLPAAVIERAKVVLAKLEAEDRASPRGFEDLPLFAAAPRPASKPAAETAADGIIAALASLHPDEMSPREALEALYALKAKAAGADPLHSSWPGSSSRPSSSRPPQTAVDARNKSGHDDP
jgi:DNA mismatch repair protein MutS